jgi:hypothetical protein
MPGSGREALPLRQPLPRLNVGRVSLAYVRARILIAAAWLLGAATATGGCLLAISLLGAGFGITASPSQQLTVAAVNRALAGAKREQPSTPAATPSRSARTRPATRRKRPARPAPTPTLTSTPAQSSAPVGTPLSSQGGIVVATCEPAGAYLLSWSPAQGYAVYQVVRGPAAVASVVFDTHSSAVTMSIACQGSTPVSSTTTRPHDE